MKSGHSRPARPAVSRCSWGRLPATCSVDDRDALEKIFEFAPLIILTHCEDSPMIRANELAARDRYGDAIPMSRHPEIRSAEACLASSTLATDLARRHDARLHVLHLTTAREMALFSPGPRTDKRITAEVCVHHLWFDSTDYESLGTRIKWQSGHQGAQRPRCAPGGAGGRQDRHCRHGPCTAHRRGKGERQLFQGNPPGCRSSNMRCCRCSISQTPVSSAWS